MVHLTINFKLCGRWSCLFGNAYILQWKHEIWVVKVPADKFVQWFLLVWLRLLQMWSENGLWEHRKVKNGSIKHRRTWTFTDVKQQCTAVWRFRSEGSGNVVLFVLSEHLGFPCWLRSGGCAGHPYWGFSIVVSPQTCTASKESVVSVYGDDETPSSVLPRLGWLT